MLLPFQAVECYLDGIYPYEGKISFRFSLKFCCLIYFCFFFKLKGTEDEGKNFLSEFIKNSTLKAVITGYAEDGIPLIKLFLSNDSCEVVFILFQFRNFF